MIVTAEARQFLSSGRIAVVGASDDPKNFGRTIVEALLDAGVDTVAVHPTSLHVAGADCYRSVAAIPGAVAGAIIMVGRDHAAAVVEDCIDAGVGSIWLFKGAGPGAVSDEAVRVCDQRGVPVVAGACPLMFLEPVKGVHLRHLNHSVEVADPTR